MGYKPSKISTQANCYLCRTELEDHRRLHDNNEYDRKLQKIAQDVYIAEHGREEYFKRYGKFYD